jgi:hypothetical protein
MTRYNSLASSDIRQYIWQVIQDENLLDRNDYYADGFADALVPIIPVQQVPEFNNLLPGRTYMLYDYEVKVVPVQWWMTDEAFTLTVISQNFDVINQITNLIHDLFRRYDESATDLNVFLGSDSDFQYHHTVIDSIMSPEPFSSEGDYQIGSVTISYSYSRKTGSDGRF